MDKLAITSLKRRFWIHGAVFAVVVAAYMLWALIAIGPVYFNTKSFRFADYCDGYFPLPRQFGWIVGVGSYDSIMREMRATGRILDILTSRLTFEEFDRLMRDAGANRILKRKTDDAVYIDYYYFHPAVPDDLQNIIEIRKYQKEHDIDMQCEKQIGATITMGDRLPEHNPKTGNWYLTSALFIGPPIRSHYYGNDFIDPDKIEIQD